MKSINYFLVNIPSEMVFLVRRSSGDIDEMKTLKISDYTSSLACICDDDIIHIQLYQDNGLFEPLLTKKVPLYDLLSLNSQYIYPELNMQITIKNWNMSECNLSQNESDFDDDEIEKTKTLFHNYCSKYNIPFC
jgi:hypothetical protein